MPRFDLKVPDEIQDRLIEKLGLSAGQERLLRLLRDNGPIDETARFSIVSGELARKGVSPTGIDGVEALLSARASAGLELALYAPGSAIELGELDLPPLHDSRRTQVLPPDRVACGIELDARFDGSASAAGSTGGWRFAVEAAGETGARFVFFREAPAGTGAADLAAATAGRFRHAFDLARRPPGEGETVVVEYRGQLRLGASLDYGWSVRGTRKQGVGLEDLDLVASATADAKLGMRAGITLEKGVRLIVRPSTRPGWLNVALHKQRERDTSFALNLRVDAELRTHALRDGVAADASALVDALLDRTPLPDLMRGAARLRGEIDPARVVAAREELIERVTGRIRGVLEGPVGDAQAFLDEVRRRVTGLVEAVEGIDDELRELLVDLLDRFPDLTRAKAALDRVATATDAETLLDGVLDEDTAAEVREILSVLSRVTGKDLSAVDALNDKVDRVRDLVARYEALDRRVLAAFEEHYTALRAQVGLDEALARVRGFLDGRLSLEDLLDEKIGWLESWLRARTGRATGRLTDVAADVRGHLTRLVAGYDDALDKARAAVRSALNRELGMQIGVAWNRVSEQQALVSVDLDPAKPAGARALRSIMRGDLEHVMTARLSNADSIRLRKSYLLDRLQRTLSVRAVVNGREGVRVAEWFASKETSIEATEDGELWVQRGEAGAGHRRESRRSMIDVSTMLQVSVAERFRIEGRELRREGVEVEALPVRFQYRKELRRKSVRPRAVINTLEALIEPMAFLPVLKTRVAGLAGRLRELGRASIGPVTIEARCRLAPTALIGALTAFGSNDEARAAARFVWDSMVPLVFVEDNEAVAAFYAANRERADALSRVETDERLNVAQRFACVHLIHTRESFQEAIADLRQHVFVDFRDDLLRRELRELAAIMEWIGGTRVRGMRNVILTAFALLVAETDRQGSAAVSYRNPSTDERMELRVDSRVSSTDA